MKRQFLAIASILSLVMVSCQNELLLDDSFISDGEGITFHISSPTNDSDQATRGETTENHIESLRYLIADANGNVLTHCFGYLSDGLDCLDLDGLGAGDYSIVFLGSSSESEFASIEDPMTLDDTWLQNTVQSLPIEGSYFFKKIDFTVGPEQKSSDYEVILDRALSKIKVEFPGIPSAVEAMISSVTVTLDEVSHVYSSINGDCSYAGEATISNYEVCDSNFNLTLNTLPSREPLSGTIKVKASTLSGDSLSTTYRFSDLTVEAGKVNRISISMRHPDFKTGFIHIRPKDYFVYKADLMLMEDEPISVLHDIAQRHFHLTEPLVLKTDHNKLRLQLYSAAPSSNVDIYANFPSLGIDSICLVHFDTVEELDAREGQYIDSGICYTNEEIVDRIHNWNNCNYGLGANNPSSGFNGWGGGKDSGYTSLIVNQDVFAKMYPTENPDTPCNRERECFYHEYAHCLGFSHEGNMTYGGVWTNTIGAAYLRAHAAGKIFFYSPDFIDNLPYKRSEASKWATPRFVEM